MKNEYNPYTVPEGFFENTRNAALSRSRRRTHAVRYGIAAVLVAAALLVPAFVQTAREQDPAEQEVLADNLAKMYDYDIFLQVSF